MEIKDRVKEVRIAIGLSQVKFAKRIAVAASFISEIEGGVREINERAIRLIIAEFNVNEIWLRTGQGVVFQEDISAKVSEAMTMFKTLDSDFQDGALKILEILIEMNSKARNSQISH